jgi:hypothetical protein
LGDREDDVVDWVGEDEELGRTGREVGSDWYEGIRQWRKVMEDLGNRWWVRNSGNGLNRR